MARYRLEIPGWQPIPTDRRFIDLTGQRIGEWTVLYYAGRKSRSCHLWYCECSCGTRRTCFGGNLRKGESLSCGGPAHRRPFTDRFWSKVRKTEGGCWEWQGARDKKGYGNFAVRKGYFRKAPQVAYELAIGPIPDGLCVLHHCDNPACCRPDHLFLGTIGDNNRDMWAKGRNAWQRRGRPQPDSRGEKQGASKLTGVQVREIRRLATRGETFRAIGQRFGIGAPHVWRIVHRRSWKHIE